MNTLRYHFSRLVTAGGQIRVFSSLLLSPYAPFIILAVGLALRLFAVANNPLWYDESFTLLVSSLPIDRLIAATAADTHPPLYYLIVRGALVDIAPAYAPLVMRLLSVFCSVFSLTQFYFITGDLDYSPRARLISLAVLALLPVEIYYAQEARMYALLQLLVLTAWLMMLRREWVPLTIVSIMTMYTHNYGVIYIGLIYLVSFVTALKQPRLVYRPGTDPVISTQEIAPLISFTFAVLAWLPWFYFSVIGQMRTVAGGYWIQPVTLPSSIFALFQIVQTTIMKPALVWLAGPALGMLLIACLSSGLKHKRMSLLLIAFAPFFAVVAFSLVWKPILLFRGLFPSIPALVLLAVEAASERRAWFWSSISLVVLASTLGTLVLENIRGTAKEESPIVLEVQAGPVVHLNEGTLLPYMVRRPALEHYLLVTGCPADPGALAEGTRKAMRIPTITADQLAGRAWSLAAQVGPLSTRCEEELFHQLTDDRQPLSMGDTRMGINGVWTYDPQH